MPSTWEDWRIRSLTINLDAGRHPLVPDTIT